MKSRQVVRISGILFFLFIFFNIIVMSDSFYVDGPNNNIYSDDTGKVGIGTINPVEKTHIAGDLFISGSGGTIAGSNLENGWLRLGSTLAMDSNELYFGTPAFIGTMTEDPLHINTNHTTRIFIDSNGSVGIGTAHPDEKLTVAGTVHARKVIVDTSAGADFVFEDDYELPPLENVESFIEENNHLPQIPPAEEMIAKGIEVAEMNVKLLQKIEELTLYIIEQNKEITELKKRMADIEEGTTGK
jgi:hypothetical protein